MNVQGLYIDGEWRTDRPVQEVRNPWDQTVVGSFAVASDDDTEDAITASHRALREGLPAFARAEILERTSLVIAGRAEEIATTLSQEAGKPITAARAEVARASIVLRLAADEARRLPSETVQLDAFEAGAGMLAFTIPEPLGVVGAITPFNFPLNLVLHKVAPALAAGCPVVLKPSERTPLTAGKMVEAFAEAGLPAGWLNLVTGDPESIVGAMQRDERIAALTFTGSSRIGWALKAASPRKHHVLELGSNAAMIVDADADLDAAVTATITSGFGYSGQTCVSVQRIYVHESILPAFQERLSAALTRVTVGDPAADDTFVGPLITPAAVERVSAWITGATDSGAELVAGGALQQGVLEPTVLTGVNPSSPLLADEVFGPVVTLVPVSSIDEAIAAVNSSRFGLNISLFTNDLSHALQYAREGEAGTVLINVMTGFRSDLMPYGGVKESGQGKEGVKYAVAEFVREKLVILADPAGRLR